MVAKGGCRCRGSGSVGVWGLELELKWTRSLTAQHSQTSYTIQRREVYVQFYFYLFFIHFDNNEKDAGCAGAKRNKPAMVTNVVNQCKEQ